ncbi:hypothetical protein JJD61_22685 [Pseudomonas carnis]|uniref:hypothetical protein n=1 Tax=Pseudomonas carnis TaxID=2487355 RepID=UPI00190B84E4|nr:hypothetical protein [Pseudomonas carnis]MBK3473512.1 hypothetical protein [Pseudomonas carnis]
MSSISPSRDTLAFTPPLHSVSPAANAFPDPVVRSKREAASNPAVDSPRRWTLQPVPLASSEGDHRLRNELATSATRHAWDSLVQIPTDSTFYAGFAALRSAFNTDEVKAWIMSKGMALDTVVVKPDSITGLVLSGRVGTRKTFTLNDDSGWWQVGARLRAAATALDRAGNGVAYVPEQSDRFSRNAVLQWHDITPPTNADELALVRGQLLAEEWSGWSTETKGRLQGSSLAARKTIDRLDERQYLAGCLADLVRNRPDDEEVSLADAQTPISATSVLARDGADKAAVRDVLISHGFLVPKTAKEVRNVIRWLQAAVAPAPALGNYAQLLARPWAPGMLSENDKRLIAQFMRDDAISRSEPSLLRALDFRGVLDEHTPQEVRANADRILERILDQPLALDWGKAAARSLYFQGTSGTYDLSTLEAKQWELTAALLQIDPEMPRRPGNVAGYDIYQPANSGRTMASVRAEIETQLAQNTLLDPKTVPLAAHLLLASSAPEFLVRDIPSTMRIGSVEWADFRLGVTFAERQGGPGCSRRMSYTEIMGLSRLSTSTPGEAAVLDNYGIDVLLDWGLMRGLYEKPVDGRYTQQHHLQAITAFNEECEQLVYALEQFNLPLPIREDSAIRNLQTVFPGLSAEQLKAMRVYIADPDERRNMKLSEPRTRTLIETYMTGDLTRDRWMLLAPGEQPPQPARRTSPFVIPRLSASDQAAVDANVQALNARIAHLPDVQAQLPGEVDAYLDKLKQGLSIATRRMIAQLPLADRQALEWGEVDLFALREATDSVPEIDVTPEQVEERRGRKGTLIRCNYNGVISYFEVFPDKLLIVKREDLPRDLALGGTFQTVPKTYGPWAVSELPVRLGAVEPFDFAAYSSNALPRPGVTSPGVIIDKLGETLHATPVSVQGEASNQVPNSFSSPRTRSIVDRIMQGNFIHHRASVLKVAHGMLPLEQKREMLRRNDSILLSMIPFVGAVIDLTKGNIVEGMRGLIIDTAGAFAGGAFGTLKPLVKSTKAVAPFGVKAFRVLEKGVEVVSGFLNPLDGAADLMAAGGKGLVALPKALGRASNPSVLLKLGVVEEKLRTCLGVSNQLQAPHNVQEQAVQPGAHNGHNHSIPVYAVQTDGRWYATHPKTGLPTGTPLDGFEALPA